jgi:biofilm PGA synthesis protein PgaA
MFAALVFCLLPGGSTAEAASPSGGSIQDSISPSGKHTDQADPAEAPESGNMPDASGSNGQAAAPSGTPVVASEASQEARRGWAVNVASYLSREKALAAAGRLSLSSPYLAYVTTHDNSKGRWYRLRVGFFQTKDEATRLADQFANALGTSAGWIIQAGIEEAEAAEPVAGSPTPPPETPGQSSVTAGQPSAQPAQESAAPTQENASSTNDQTKEAAPETGQPSAKQELTRDQIDHQRALKLIKKGKNREALSILAPYTREPMTYPEITSDYLAILVWEGKLKEATGKYEHLPKEFPRNAFLLRNMGKAYYDLGNYAKAVSFYEAALKLTPLDQIAQQGLVLSTLRAGNANKAAVLLDGFLLKAPTSLPLNMAKPYVLAGQDKYAEALKAFRSLLERKDVQKEDIYQQREHLIVGLSGKKRSTMLADLRKAARGKDIAASKDYVLVLGLTRNFKKAVDVFESARLSKKQLDRYELSWIAWSYYKVENLARSKAFYRYILRSNPEDLRANIGMAYVLTTEGKSDDAMVILNRLLKKHPRNIDILYARAFVFEEQKKYRQAASDYKRILKIAPDAKAAQPPLVVNLVRAGQADQAARRLDSFLRKSPRYLPLVRIKPMVLAAQGHYVEALKEYRRIAGIKGLDTERLFSERNNMITSLPSAKREALLRNLKKSISRGDLSATQDVVLILALSKKYKLAVKEFEASALPADSYSTDGLSWVAWSYFKAGETKKAQSFYKKILTEKPDHIGARLGMAYTLAHEGTRLTMVRGKEKEGARKTHEAMAILDRLLEKHPRNIDVHYARAFVFEGQKKYQQAANEYKHILKIAPDAKAAQPALVLNLVRAGHANEAASKLEMFLKRDPGNLSLILVKPKVLAGQDKYIEALQEYRKIARRKDTDADQIFRDRDNMIASLPAAKREVLLANLHDAVARGDTTAIQDFILVQTLNKGYSKAIQQFEEGNLPPEQYTDDELSWIAWAYFKTGNLDKSKFYYQKILSRNPNYMRARLGMAYNLAAEGGKLLKIKGKDKEAAAKTDEALSIVDDLLKENPDDLEVHFARAYVFEQKRMFWNAIREYDEIQKIVPNNLIALKLKIMALSFLGASTIAIEEAKSKLPQDIRLQEAIRGDMVVDTLHWEEYRKAKGEIIPLLADKKNLRPQFDYIVTLAENRDMKEAVSAYEQMLKEGISPPFYVHESAGRAYLYLEQPDKALEAYDRALALKPMSYNARLGKFYVFQETRKWKEAKEILANLDKEYPWTYWEGKTKRPEPRKLEIAITKGWEMIYEDRLEEAEEYFWNLREQAPGNTDIRSGLAHTYLFRGWPRKALTEFRIIETMDPENTEAKVGKILAMNELELKEEARKEKNDLIYMPRKENYKLKHVKKLDRTLLLEEKLRVGADLVLETSGDQSTDYLARIRFAEPITLHTDLTGYYLRRKTAQIAAFGQFDRAGLGIDHRFNSDWRVMQSFGIDVNRGGDFGSLTDLFFTPDDHWLLEASYDSFAWDVPLRARAFGIDARKAFGGITYRQSEWREISLGYTHWDFSDKNNRDEGLLSYEQGLWSKNDWMMRGFAEWYLARNSMIGRPYFNPRWAWSLSATLLTQQTVWSIYNKKFVHKLFLTAGSYNQSAFGNKGLYSIRYQQEFDFSDTQALLWGVTWGKQPFDGLGVVTRNIYLTYEGKF